MTHLVYFDSNVLIDICEGRLDGLRSYVLESAKTAEVGFPFSAAQISEITKYPLTHRCRERLEFVGKMSNNLYFVHSVYDYGFKTRSPYDVWETINEALPEFDEKSFLSELVPFDLMKGAREELGLDPRELNNLSGVEAVEIIDKALSDSVPESASGPRSIRELLEYTKLINRQTFAKQWDAMGTSEAHMTIGSDLHVIFSLLEAFGYWPDTEKVYRKGSRFPDSQHVFNSAHCHCLVTRDKGMKNRAEAVFSILGIDINILHTEQYISELGLS
ncbi:hypothetical protein SAMN04487958_11929 [Vreelandella subterranea]|uniref:PIN domain-containing protein n=1 Tax=Vreelandella subterranea TaxID=416874 RepID=A0A1H9WRJ9_9GAMM|nr:hypothetical protein [Halomonas subterranea]SES36013.1 hypothetical protein SAMN04487958_11929 [Halomonas subterranea]